MASVFEINSFVGKFLHLWNTGRNASLNIESQAGNAAVTLRLDLGQPSQQPHHFHGTNAGDRCRQRRADSRKSAAEEAQSVTSESKEVVEEATSKTRTVGKD